MKALIVLELLSSLSTGSAVSYPPVQRTQSPGNPKVVQRRTPHGACAIPAADPNQASSLVVSSLSLKNNSLHLTQT